MCRKGRHCSLPSAAHMHIHIHTYTRARGCVARDERAMRADRRGGERELAEETGAAVRVAGNWNRSAGSALSLSSLSISLLRVSPAAARIPGRV